MLLELPGFTHIDATDIEEAIFCLHKHGEQARVIAGATDLLGLMKDRIEGPEFRIPKCLINIKPIEQMNRIAYSEEEGLSIGAAVTLNRLITSDVIRQHANILSQAALRVGTTPLRNMGTIGGNLCQKPRCLYFRHPHFVCFKKGGGKCYAVTGEHRYYHSILRIGKCAMAHPSDLAPPLIALRARAVIVGGDGEKKVPLEEFFLDGNHLAETILKPGEFLKEVQVPPQDHVTHQLFLKQRIRHAADFALSSVAMVARISHGVCKEMRIVLGGVAPLPHLALLTNEILKGKSLNDGLLSKAAEASIEGATPLPMNRYKLDLTKALVRRVLASVT